MRTPGTIIYNEKWELTGRRKAALERLAERISAFRARATSGGEAAGIVVIVLAVADEDVSHAQR